MKKILLLALAVNVASGMVPQAPLEEVGPGLNLRFKNWQITDLIDAEQTQGGLWVVNNTEEDLDLIEVPFASASEKNKVKLVLAEDGKLFVGNLNKLSFASSFFITIHGAYKQQLTELIGIALGTDVKGAFTLADFSPAFPAFGKYELPKDKDLVITLDEYDIYAGIKGSAEWVNTTDRPINSAAVFGRLNQKLAEDKDPYVWYVLDLPYYYNKEQLEHAYAAKRDLLNHMQAPKEVFDFVDLAYEQLTALLNISIAQRLGLAALAKIIVDKEMAQDVLKSLKK